MAIRKTRERFEEGADFLRDEDGTVYLTPAGYLVLIFNYQDEIAWLLHREMVDAMQRAKAWRYLGQFFPVEDGAS